MQSITTMKGLYIVHRLTHSNTANLARFICHTRINNITHLIKQRQTLAKNRQQCTHFPQFTCVRLSTTHPLLLLD